MKTVARRATRNDLGDGGWTGTVLMERRGPIAGVRASPCLVFFREHHGEDARRDRRIGGIGRGQLQVCVVVVDLQKRRTSPSWTTPKARSPCGSLSSSKLSNARILARIKRRRSTGRDSNPAARTTTPPQERATKRVVKFLDSGDGIRAFVGHATFSGM
jgi:hypothetical protein